MKYFLMVLIALFLSASAVTSADTLLVDSIDQAPANATDGLQRATRGMSMSQVERSFGAPGNKLAPVGEPPISRWIYPGYTVYFEHHLVLTSVVNRKDL